MTCSDSARPDDLSRITDRFRNLDSPEFIALLAELRAHTNELEASNATPKAQLDRMAAADVMRWDIPVEFGGLDLSAADRTAGFERLASACLVSTFVLSQRSAAVTRIVSCGRPAVRERYLPRLATHEIMATVGISHLTTSRQHLSRPAVSAMPLESPNEAGGFRLNGFVPWVTGAELCDFMLTGGTLADGRQILAMVPTDHPGVRLETPPPLLALDASRTGSVTLSDVDVAAADIVAGPISGVMKVSSGGTGSVTTSALATGMAWGVLQHFAAEAERRPDLLPISEPLIAERAAISADIRRLLENPETAPAGLTSESIRGRANSLALRSSQAYLAASKGAGFVKGHPAERAVREAMFFLVWSCPQPVVQAALRQFACLTE